MPRQVNKLIRQRRPPCTLSPDATVEDARHTYKQFRTQNLERFTRIAQLKYLALAHQSFSGREHG